MSRLLTHITFLKGTRDECRVTGDEGRVLSEKYESRKSNVEEINLQSVRRNHKSDLSRQRREIINHKLIFVLFLTMVYGLWSMDLHAQKDSKRMERANALFEDYSYIQAIQEYEKLLKKNPDFAEAKLKLAECYRLTKKMDSAEKWYRSAAQQEAVDSVYMYNYASVLKYNKKYDEAKDWYLQYETYKSDGRGLKQAKFLDLIHYFVRDSSKVEIKNMGFNSEYADFSPAFFKEGLLYASSQTKGKNAGGLDQWTGENFLDLYYIEKVNIDSSGKSKLLQGFINSNYHEGPSCYDRHNDIIYFTRNTIEKGVQKRSREGVLKIQIYTARQADKRWDVIEKFSLDNPDYIYCHPSLSHDGARIYFASDMPGGFGGLDIYYADKQGDSWAQPVNMGSYVNTQWNEAFPYIHSTGTLYFASDGLPGLGGLDVYSVRFGGREWMDVKNLGYPINTSTDDFGFILDSTNKSGYVSSNRTGGKGSDDIYSIFIKDTYFEEGVLLTMDEEALKEPDDEVNDFDYLDSPENLPAEAFQPATYDTVAGMAVIPANDALLDALSMQMFKPDYAQEEELAMKVMKDEKAIAAEAKKVQQQQEQKQKEAADIADNTDDGFSSASKPVSKAKAPAEEKSPDTAMRSVTSSTPSKSSTPATSKTPSSSTAATKNATSATTTAKPALTLEEQMEKMKDSKGRLILERTPYVLKTKNIEGLTYRVQVGAYNNPLRKSPDVLFKTKGIETYNMNDGITRYVTPHTFNDIKTAEAHKKQMVLLGNRDAFIVPFYNGRRIAAEEVLQMLNR
jgi:tetratricopeptide (TPR) repeat protein